MKRVISTLDRIYNRCVDYFFYGSQALIIALLLVVVADVIIRYTVKGSITWGFEFTEYALVYITFLGTVWLLRQDGHVKMDVLLTALKPPSKMYLNFIASLLLVISCVLLLWYGTSSTIDNIKNNVMSVKFYSVPKFIFIIIIPISSFLLLIEALKTVVRNYRSLNPPRS